MSYNKSEHGVITTFKRLQSKKWDETGARRSHDCDKDDDQTLDPKGRKMLNLVVPLLVELYASSRTDAVAYSASNLQHQITALLHCVYYIPVTVQCQLPVLETAEPRWQLHHFTNLMPSLWHFSSLCLSG